MITETLWHTKNCGINHLLNWMILLGINLQKIQKNIPDEHFCNTISCKCLKSYNENV